MKKLIFLTLAVGIGSAFAAEAQNDPAAYKSGWAKAGADYKTAKAACGAQAGNAKKICVEQAKAARAHAEADTVAAYRNTPSAVTKARTAVVNAEYDVARAKCADRGGSERSTCLDDAKSSRMTALAEVKSGTSTSSGHMAATKSEAMQDQSTAATTPMADSKSGSAKVAIADTVITTKVKADLIKDPDLKAMDVHVETVKGVVMLSGFVPSEAEAAKAVELARGVAGVSDVKSTLKVK